MKIVKKYKHYYLCKLCDDVCFKYSYLKSIIMSQNRKNKVFNNVENSGNETENIKNKCNCVKHIDIAVNYLNIINYVKYISYIL